MPERSDPRPRPSSAAPNRPHRFEVFKDPFAGYAAAGVGRASPNVGWAQALVVANAQQRAARCSLCGRTRDEAIHEVDE